MTGRDVANAPAGTAYVQATRPHTVLTHSQETCTRNLIVQVDLYKKLDRLTWFLVQDFYCTSFLHRIHTRNLHARDYNGEL